MLTLFALWTWRAEIGNWLVADELTAWPLVFVAAMLLALIPFLPYGAVSALLGVKYGFFSGGMMVVVASSFAACLTYWLFRYVFSEWGKVLLSNYARLHQVNGYMRKRSFLFILLARLIPIMPAFLINSYCGVYRYPLGAFLAATLLGKIPAMLVFAYLGENAWQGSMDWLIVIGIYALFLFVVYGSSRLMINKQPKNEK